MAKVFKPCKCVHCLRYCDSPTSDHVFPKSWYPDTTPQNMEKWQIPSCENCNTEYSKIENESKYKRRAYQYTLSSIMLNNVKNEYNEVKAQIAAKTDVETQTDVKTDVSVVSLQDLKIEKRQAPEKTAIKLKIEETVATVASKVSGLMTPKKKGPGVSVSVATTLVSEAISVSEANTIEEKEDEKTEEKTGEKKLSIAN